MVRQLDFTTKELRYPHRFPNRVDFLRHLKNLYATNEAWIIRAYKQIGWDRPHIQNAFFTHCRDALEANGELPDSLNRVALEHYARRDLYDHYDLDYNSLNLSQEQILAVENTFRQGYSAPLIAIIYAHCPGLVRTHAHLAAKDVFHSDIVSWAGYGATGENRPQAIAFQKLESLSIKPAMSVDERGRPMTAEQVGPSEITLTNCYYRLPKIKEIFMMPARVRIGGLDPYHIEYESPIQKLTLEIHKSSRFDYDAFFPMLKNLRQLSLILPRADSRNHGPVLHHKLWTVLDHLNDRLEYLDIYQGDFITTPGGPILCTTTDSYFCAPFAKFTRLKYLATTPLILNGHQCQHTPGTKLAAHLPPNLISLALYTENNSIERDYIFDLSTEETNLVAEAAATGIQCITLDSDIDGPFPISAMVSEAQRHPRLIFQYNEPDSMLFGGEQAPFADFSRERFRVEACRVKRRRTKIPSIIPKGLEVLGWKGELGHGRRRRREREGLRDVYWAGAAKRTKLLA
ncbi:hypothetical protein BJX63DRAFT_435024 [Aspergillus granulosus]|uniref:Uncharacterized protein n=1 Tax=Aspergillus granulosus TaxID=176169 RepID=A0ABR4H2G5_9EURO